MDRILEDFISDPVKDILVICNTYAPVTKFKIFRDNLRYREVDCLVSPRSLSVHYKDSSILFTTCSRERFPEFIDSMRGHCFQMVYLDCGISEDEEWFLKSKIRPHMSWDESKSKDFVSSIGSRLVFTKESKVRNI